MKALAHLGGGLLALTLWPQLALALPWGDWRPVERSLPNGLTLQVVPRHHLPLVSLSLTMRAGGVVEGPGEAGWADLAAAMLGRGTRKHSAAQWDERIEATGARLELGAGQEAAWVQLSLRAQDAKQGLAWIAELVAEPSFLPAEVKRLQLEAESETKALLEDGDAMAQLALKEGLLRGTPWAHRSSLGSLRGLSAPRLKAFAAKHHRPEGALLQIVGDLPASEALAWAEASLGPWKGASPEAQATSSPRLASPGPTALPEAPASGARVRELLLIDAPLTQAFLLWGQRCPGLAAPERLALKAANFPLGGDFTARLTQELRDRRGLAYGAYSQVQGTSQVGWWTAGLNTRLPRAQEAAEGLLSMLERYAQEGPTEAEAALAREHLQGAFPMAFEANDEVADALVRPWLSGLPTLSLAQEGAVLGRFTRQELAQVAKAHLRPAQGVLVAVGPKAQLQPILQGLGPLRVLSKSELIR